MLIREDAIREIRERASITEIVSDVVAIKRRGRSATGLCPFHTEKTPSFTVSEERGFYHCFGCGEHGDVFSFVMKTQSLPFPEAVRVVAQRFGLPVPTEASGPRQRTEPLIAVNQAAAAWFRAQLQGPQGARCRKYVEERGITAASIERYGLGYAPGSGDALARQLRADGQSIDDALTAGLVGRSQDGRLYDRFRDRLMFPISDLAGRTIAFGGRVLPGAPASDNPPPKYLNSPESPLFKKGQTVYGLALARDAIRARDRVVVVEGYLDVIAVAQAGIGEVVAPLGTALTVDQLRVLRRFTEAVIACFDGDEAGRRAAARSFPTFVEAGLWGRGVFLPAGDDPDTFVRSRGGDALARELERAVPLVDAYVDSLAGTRLDAVGRRADAAKEVARVLRGVDNPFERDVLARLAADRLGVREQMLRGEVTPAAAPPAAARTSAPSVEQQLVELMALEPRLAEQVGASGVIAEFEEPTWRALAESMVAGAATDDPAAVIERLPRDLRDRVVRRLLDTEQDDRERALADLIGAIRARRSGRTRGALIEALRAAEARGDVAAARAAQEELNRSLSEKNRT
ncbi:MAG TPA: DNA primase [Candidatus Eisenbacteria bacterium]|nr:DNA primase [Candidatus Eisenbacteria bacterium]